MELNAKAGLCGFTIKTETTPQGEYCALLTLNGTDWSKQFWSEAELSGFIDGVGMGQDMVTGMLQLEES